MTQSLRKRLRDSVYTRTTGNRCHRRIHTIWFFGLLAVSQLPMPVHADRTTIVVGGKRFTESSLLAELVAQVIEIQTNLSVERRLNLAGTTVAFEALRRGELDILTDYTGTLWQGLMKQPGGQLTGMQLFKRLAEFLNRHYHIVMLAPLGFNNTYALTMRKKHASELGIRNISDLKKHPLRYGVSHEFRRRSDGIPGLRRHYGLNEASVVNLDHDLAYQALLLGKIDVTDGYSTDAKLINPELVTLKDDRSFFPIYEAVTFIHKDTLQTHPSLAAVLSALAGRIDEQTMQQLNYRVEVERRRVPQVVTEFLRHHGIGQRRVVDRPRSLSFWRLSWERRMKTLELLRDHMVLTTLAILIACAFAIPLGIILSTRRRAATAVLTISGLIQTIPSIALLAFLLIFFGVGVKPALFALILYSLLPVLRNTLTGLQSVDPEIIEVGRGLGMRPLQLLFRVELPLASSFILAGVRTATVISVGTATLAAFIGAGGLGDPIVTGLTMSDFPLMMTGAIPAALLAVTLDAILGLVEKRAVPDGLRNGRFAE